MVFAVTKRYYHESGVTPRAFGADPSEAAIACCARLVHADGLRRQCGWPWPMPVRRCKRGSHVRLWADRQLYQTARTEEPGGQREEREEGGVWRTSIGGDLEGDGPGGSANQTKHIQMDTKGYCVLGAVAPLIAVRI